MKVTRLLLFAIMVSNGNAFCTELAITIDDLPAAGTEVPGKTRTEVAKEFISTLQGEKIKSVYGFVNAILAKNMSERLKIIESWKQAGFQIGNHTYSHKDLAKSTAEEYIENIEKNEPLLLDFARSIPEIKVFRYPFLSEGETQEKRYAIRSYLTNRNYKIAPVTVDFEDWSYLPAYAKCLSVNDKTGLSRLEQIYLDNAKENLNYAIEIARRIYHREIKHVLLLHFNGFTGHMLGPLLREFKKENVRFISLEDAMKDPIYQEDTVYFHSEGTTFLFQARDSRKLTFPDLKKPKPPRDSLNSYCEGS